MRWARVWVMVGAVALAAVPAACGGGGDDEEPAAEPPPTTTTIPVPVTPAQVPPSRCQAAAEDDLIDIQLSMTSFDTHVTEGRTATVGAFRYVAGNLRENDGAAIAGPAVWAFDGEVLYAVSDLAATYSAFFPTRPPLGPVADDDAVAALLACVPAP